MIIMYDYKGKKINGDEIKYEIKNMQLYRYIISLQYMYKNMFLDINVTTKFEHNRGNGSLH